MLNQNGILYCVIYGFERCDIGLLQFNILQNPRNFTSVSAIFLMERYTIKNYVVNNIQNSII